MPLCYGLPVGDLTQVMPGNIIGNLSHVNPAEKASGCKNKEHEKQKLLFLIFRASLIRMR